MSSYKKVALISLFSRGLKVISGPVVLLAMSTLLTSEEMAFYFTFLSVVAFKQMAELGIGYTLKQFTAHAFKLNQEGVWLEKSRGIIKGYHKFAVRWFLFVSLFMLLIIGFIGYLFFKDYDGTVNWLTPWLCLVLVLSISLLFMPFQIILEGAQKQESVYKSRLRYALANAVTLVLCFYFDFGLYSIAIASILSNSILYLTLLGDIKWLLSSFRNLDVNISFVDVAKELWPVCSRVSIIWCVGFFFWNSFNLISFKVFDLELAGKISFSLAMAKAGYSIAESILASQLTFYSNMVAKGQATSAINRFYKFRSISILLAISGYGFAICCMYLFPDFFVVEKMVGVNLFVQIAIYFTILLFITSQNNFVRCYKVEPFLKLSLFNAIAVPASFYFVALTDHDYAFIGCIVMLCINLVFSNKVFNNFVSIKSK